MALLEVSGLNISFMQYGKGMRSTASETVRDLSVSADAGQVTAVVGASGSGKSLLAHAIMGILPDNARVSGTVVYDGSPLDAKRLDRLRGREIALVPQSVNHLDPLMRVGAQVRITADGPLPASRLRDIFRRLRLSDRAERMFPHQLSGGMARRVLVSTAVAGGARLVIADEPTPGMQAEDAEQAMSMLRELADQGAAVLLITHDIGAALPVADRVAVFYAGTTVEVAAAEDFAGDGGGLRHPYSRALWRALPQNGFAPPSGSPLPAQAVTEGCPFAPGCEIAARLCKERMPAVQRLRGGEARCHHAT